MQSNRCFYCVHYEGMLKCKAFPDRIPEEILMGLNNHTKPLKDQGNDIVFKERKV